MRWVDYNVNLSPFLTESVFFGIKNFSSLFIPIIFASNFGYFFVNSLNLIFIDLQLSLIKISRSLILFSAKGTLSSAPGASNFRCIDLAISISGEIITSMVNSLYYKHQ